MQANDPVERMRFRRAPLAAAAVWFALGIAAARWQAQDLVTLPAVEMLAGLLLLAGIAAFSVLRAQRVAWGAVAAIWIVLGLAAGEWQPTAEYPVKLMEYADNLSREVTARVVGVRPGALPAGADGDEIPAWESTEEPQSGAGRPLSVDLELEQVEYLTPDVSRMVAISGGVRVSIYNAEGLTLGCGDRVSLPLRLRPIGRYRDPGVFQLAIT